MSAGKVILLKVRNGGPPTERSEVELVLSSRGDQRTIGPEWERVKSGYIVLVLDLHSPCLYMFVSRRHDHAWSLPTARDQRRLLQILFVCSLVQITSPSLY
jgi:hypothetical protein